jgi:hypothetical protein
MEKYGKGLDGAANSFAGHRPANNCISSQQGSKSSKNAYAMKTISNPSSSTRGKFMDLMLNKTHGGTS